MLDKNNRSKFAVIAGKFDTMAQAKKAMPQVESALWRHYPKAMFDNPIGIMESTKEFSPVLSVAI